MATKTLKPKVKAWEKAGIVLLNKYLDTLAPVLREWIYTEKLKRWPEPEEFWAWCSDLEDEGAMEGYYILIRAFGHIDCAEDPEKLAYLITNRWPKPRDVPPAPRSEIARKTAKKRGGPRSAE
jgi:hypothetical protein